MKRLRLSLLLSGAGALLVAGAIVYAAKRIEGASARAVSADLAALPRKRVGLVLGCSPVLGSGAPNRYFQNRIAAAAAVFHAGKVDHLLVSGDNHAADYDEPSAMKEALVRLGVPGDRIALDHAGFSTLDSVVRARKVFGLSEFCVITQRDHARRAIYIARAQGIDAVAFPARDVPARHALRTRVRESLARVRTLLDVHVLGRAPRFLGPPVEIGLGQAGLAEAETNR